MTKTPPIKNQFKTGDLVSFVPSGQKHKNIRCLGILIKKNPKRSKVNVKIGAVLGNWVVPYYFLHRITQEEKTLLAVEKLKG